MARNGDIVRRVAEVVSQGESVDAVMADLEQFMDPEIEWVNPPDAIEGGTRNGIAGIRIAFENFVSGAGADATVELDELEECGDRVFIQWRVHAKGETSGAAVVGPPVGVVYTFRDGRILRIEWDYDVAKARAALDRDG
jgi:ketosteroid isomerase-like protein